MNQKNSKFAVSDATAMVFAKIVAVILGVLLIPYILTFVIFGVGKLVGQYETRRYQSTSEFSSAQWKKDQMYRFSVLDHVVGSSMLIGKGEEEVVELLGLPDRRKNRRNSSEWGYEAIRPGESFLGFDLDEGEGIWIKFNDQKRVSSVYRIRTT